MHDTELVLGWVTAWEYLVLQAFFFFFYRDLVQILTILNLRWLSCPFS